MTLIPSDQSSSVKTAPPVTWEPLLLLLGLWHSSWVEKRKSSLLWESLFSSYPRWNGSFHVHSCSYSPCFCWKLQFERKAFLMEVQPGRWSEPLATSLMFLSIRWATSPDFLVGKYVELRAHLVKIYTFLTVPWGQVFFTSSSKTYRVSSVALTWPYGSGVNEKFARTAIDWP